MTELATGRFAFKVDARDGDARAGVLTTPHATVLTPTFMPVGTQGSVKTLTPAEVSQTGRESFSGNLSSLARPGPDVVQRAGGLHAFTRWPHAMLTDSGGYQAFSMSERRTLGPDGFVFRSHLDGSRRVLSPEVAMAVQASLGADIAMQLDVCPPGDAPRTEVAGACSMTTAWAKRCLAAKAPSQAVFGIVQGGTYVDLRSDHAEELATMPFDGLALGGFSVGEPIARMHEVLCEVGAKLDATRPRYLMGVGTPRDLVVGIGAGIDMFDCVLPTRNARNGQALLRRGRIVIKQARFRDDPLPLDPRCECVACAGGYSRL